MTKPTEDEVKARLHEARSEQRAYGHDWDIADIVPVVMQLIAESQPVPEEHLTQLQEEADNGFHKKLQAWVDDSSGVARVLRVMGKRNNS